MKIIESVSLGSWRPCTAPINKSQEAGIQGVLVHRYGEPVDNIYIFCDFFFILCSNVFLTLGKGIRRGFGYVQALYEI